MEGLSIPELEQNLKEYNEQLEQVKQCLLTDPGNDEYEEMGNGLLEVIDLTKELLAAARQSEAAEAPPPPSPSGPPSQGPTPSQQQSAEAAAGPGGGHGRFPAGAEIEALWSEDGRWYNATVVEATERGYRVLYDEFGNNDEVAAADVRARGGKEAAAAQEGAERGKGGAEAPPEGQQDPLAAAAREAEEARQALKRKIEMAAKAEVPDMALPAKLRISPDDPEDVVAAKRKKIHQFKSQKRLEAAELQQHKRQNSWQQFQSSKSKQKQVGFFTGRKKESMFKSPDDPKGKVGVIGSGRGITQFQQREKHLHTKVLGGEED